MGGEDLAENGDVASDSFAFDRREAKGSHE